MSAFDPKRNLGLVEEGRCLRRPCLSPTGKSALDRFTFEIGCPVNEASMLEAVEGLYI